MKFIDEGIFLLNCKLFRLHTARASIQCDLNKYNKPLYTPHFTIPVGSVVLFRIVSVSVPIASGVDILHITWEGSGLHLSSSPHTERGGDGANPG